MKTIDGNATHRHRWQRIGAHTLHVGQLLGVAIRQVRHVSKCTVKDCTELRVHIRHERAVAVTEDQKEALLHQTKRIPGQSAVALVRRKKYTYEKVPDPRLAETRIVTIKYVNAAQTGHRPKPPGSRE